MKLYKNFLYAAAALSLLATNAFAAPAQITAKPYDRDGRPVDPVYVVVVGVDGQLGLVNLGTVTLGPGSAIAGKVGIDQTTDGTTNGISVRASGNAIASSNIAGSGNNSGFSAQGLKVDAILGLQNATLGNVNPARDAVGAAALGNGGLGSISVEEGGRTYTNITTATTTTPKATKGFLRSITFNTCVASATVTLWDNTSAATTKIGTITCPATVGNPFTLNYDIGFAVGLTIVTSAVTDITVAWR